MARATAPQQTLQIELARREVMFLLHSLQSTKGSYARMPWIPKPTSVWIARILHGIWIMDKIRARRETTIELHCQPDQFLTEISLEADERLGFSVGSLAGFSSSVRLRTNINAGIGRFAVGRVFSHVAIGPGSVFFVTRGRPIQVVDRSYSFDPNQLLAWSPTVEFSSDQLDNFDELFLARLCLTVANPDRERNQAWIAATMTAKKGASGIFSVLRHMFLGH